MAFLVQLILLTPLLLFIYILIVIQVSRNNSYAIPINWPLFGMIPKSILNSHRIYDYITDILAYSGGTFAFKSPSFVKTAKLCTANPLDVHHILSKNFSNYPRGDMFRQIFDILGDGFSVPDGELWEFHNTTIRSLFKSPNFQRFLEQTIWKKVENGLLPVLENVCKKEMEIDLQDVFQRFAFDTICMMLIDSDPKSMSLDLPYIPCEKALSAIEEAILRRYIMPPRVWKFQQLLQFGNEKKLSNAWKDVDEFIYKCLAQKQEEFRDLNTEVDQDDEYTLSKAFFRSYQGQTGSSGDSNKFLRDSLLNLVVAGRDTNSSALSWLFYLLAKNPKVEDKILEEINTQVNMNKRGNLKDLQDNINLDTLVYLHGALCEALRLFPPVPFQVKSPLQPDILPSGHRVGKNTTIILSFYSMGRMESIWGKDCLEFKPERWVSKTGRINHQPSYKFPAFNAGPRTCLGKHVSFTQMKIVASTILYHYHVNVVEGHLVFPNDSIILKMKNGLKVRLTKRSKVEV